MAKIIVEVTSMLHKGDLLMANAELTRLFLDDLKNFLQNSNPNLGRKSTKREVFINEILNRVRDFVGDPEADQEESPQDKQSRLRQRRTAAMQDNVLCMEPNEQIRKATNEKGGAMMTEETSMQADTELGNPHNMTKEE